MKGTVLDFCDFAENVLDNLAVPFLKCWDYGYFCYYFSATGLTLHQHNDVTVGRCRGRLAHRVRLASRIPRSASCCSRKWTEWRGMDYTVSLL